MTSLIEKLETAAFPQDYADLVAETLSVDSSNYLAVKDTLFALRSLSERQFTEVVTALNSSDQ